MRTWIYPANPKMYDVEKAFTESKTTPWPISSSVEVGDIVYIYCGVPFKQILFKCEVTQVGLQMDEVIDEVKDYIKSTGQQKSKKNKSFMYLNVKERFMASGSSPLCFANLRQHGLKGSIMGPQCLDNNMELFDYIREV